METIDIQYEAVETYTLTCKLRFVERDVSIASDTVATIKVLQQALISTKGNIIWEDVPLEKETE